MIEIDYQDTTEDHQHDQLRRSNLRTSHESHDPYNRKTETSRHGNHNHRFKENQAMQMQKKNL